jgi:hypothetical protein
MIRRLVEKNGEHQRLLEQNQRTVGSLFFSRTMSYSRTQKAQSPGAISGLCGPLPNKANWHMSNCHQAFLHQKENLCNMFL